jgi:flagellar secretion chaperone FliS
VLTRNPYERYAEANLLSATPLQLVVMLYEFALENVHAACASDRAGDPLARGRAVNKALDALVELTTSCDTTVELTGNLRELYGYMQSRLIEGHTEQSQAKMQEVAGLLKTLLDAWRQIAASGESQVYVSGPELPAAVVAPAAFPAVSAAYGRF